VIRPFVCRKEASANRDTGRRVVLHGNYRENRFAVFLGVSCGNSMGGEESTFVFRANGLHPECGDAEGCGALPRQVQVADVVVGEFLALELLHASEGAFPVRPAR